MDHRRALLVVVTDLEILALGANAFVEVVDLDGGLDRVERHPTVDLAAHAPGEVRLAGLEHVGVGPIRLDLVAAVAYERMRPAGSGLGLGELDGAGDEIAGDDLVDDAEFSRFLGVERLAREDRIHGPFGTDESGQSLGTTAPGQ